jgi:hypothetical protein
LNLQAQQQSHSVFDRVQVPLIVIAETVVCLGITKGGCDLTNLFSRIARDTSPGG